MDRNNKGILLEVGTNEVEFLLFNVTGQRYGINVSKVCQIVLFDPSKLAEIPKQRKEVLGLMSFRDKTISVIDLRQLLHPAKDIATTGRELLLVSQFNNRTMGFVVDSVDRIERCSWDEFEPIGEVTTNNASGNVVGMVTLKEGIVLILDLETLIGELDPSMTMEAFQSKVAGPNEFKNHISIVSCEDSATVQRLLIRRLNQAGYTQVHSFSNGAEGLSFLQKSDPSAVNLIITDIEMPTMDGLTLCKRLRELEGYKDKPVIFFSSIIDEQMKVKCKAVGGNAAFSKPQIDLIVDKIEELLADE